jgi:hypothetical protein
VGVEPDRGRAEGVREDHVGAGVDVRAMDLGHGVGPFEVQQVGSLAGRQALHLEIGAHRAVEDEHAFGECGQKAHGSPFRDC